MPLSAEQKAFAQKRIAAGDKPDDVFEFLASKVEQEGATQTRGLQETAKTTLGILVDPMNTLIKTSSALLKGGAAYGTGEVAAKLAGMAPPPYRLPLTVGARLVGQGVGQAGGEITRQAISGEPINVDQARAEARGVMLSGGIMEGVGAGAAYVGGIRPSDIGRGLENPAKNLKKATPQDWYNTGKDLIGDTGAEAMIVTEGRRRMEDIMKVADQSGHKIDGRNMVDLLRRRLSGSSHPALSAADAKLAQMADNLELDIMQRSGGTGFLKPSEFDEIFQRDFTRPKFDAANTPEWGPDFKGRHSQVRDQIAEKFYSDLGPEMGQAAREANNMISIREGLSDELFPRSRDPKPGRVGQKLRSTVSESNIAGMDITKALETYDEAYGKNFAERLKSLDTREAFNPIGRAEGQELAQMGLLNYKPRGLVSAGLTKIAKKLMQWGGNSKMGVMARSLAADLINEAKSHDEQQSANPANAKTWEAPSSMP